MGLSPNGRAGSTIALVAVASSLMILCMRLFSGSLARRASRVRRVIGFRGSTMSHSLKKNVQTTRRILLQTAIGAVSAVSFLGLTARGAEYAVADGMGFAWVDGRRLCRGQSGHFGGTLSYADSGGGWILEGRAFHSDRLSPGLFLRYPGYANHPALADGAR